MIEFLTIGEPLYGMRSLDVDVDLEHVVNFERYIAGAEYGISVGMSRLGFDVGYITRLGKDVFSKYIIQELERNNISTDFVSYSDDRNTAFQLKSNVSDGDPVFGYLRKQSAGAYMPTEAIDDIDFSTIKHVHITGLFAALSDQNFESLNRLIKVAREHDISITFDPNLRPQLWESEEIMRERINALAIQADVVLPGLGEGKILTNKDTPDEVADFYLNQGVKTVITKLGPEGAHIRTKDDEGNAVSEVIPGFVVDVVDTVGAGDGFAIGAMSGMLKGLSVQKSVERAVAIGALAVTKTGDSEGYPTEEELQDFIKNGKRYRA